MLETIELSDPARRALRDARRAWFRAGVRRGDRNALVADLGAELAGAEAAGLSDAAVLGDDPTKTAMDWAIARELSDRRLRLSVVIVPALLAGVLCSGALLVGLTDSFEHNDRSVLGHVAERYSLGLIAFYVVTALIAGAAISVTAGAMLRAVGDHTAGATVCSLLIALPVGAILATAVGVLVAGSRHYEAERATVEQVCPAVLVVLALTITVARWAAVRHCQTSTGST